MEPFEITEKCIDCGMFPYCDLTNQDPDHSLKSIPGPQCPANRDGKGPGKFMLVRVEE